MAVVRTASCCPPMSTMSSTTATRVTTRSGRRPTPRRHRVNRVHHQHHRAARAETRRAGRGGDRRRGCAVRRCRPGAGAWGRRPLWEIERCSVSVCVCGRHLRIAQKSSSIWSSTSWGLVIRLVRLVRLVRIWSSISGGRCRAMVVPGRGLWGTCPAPAARRFAKILRVTLTHRTPHA